MPKAWCAEARDGLWCAAADTWTPDSVTASIPTLCGRHIVLPYGVSERVPTCPDCRAKHATRPEEDGE